jgi:hypothetical protein
MNGSGVQTRGFVPRNIRLFKNPYPHLPERLYICLVLLTKGRRLEAFWKVEQLRWWCFVATRIPSRRRRWGGDAPHARCGSRGFRLANGNPGRGRGSARGQYDPPRRCSLTEDGGSAFSRVGSDSDSDAHAMSLETKLVQRMAGHRRKREARPHVSTRCRRWSAARRARLARDALCIRKDAGPRRCASRRSVTPSLCEGERKPLRRPPRRKEQGR